LPGPDAASLLQGFLRRISRLRGVRASGDSARLAGELRQADVDHLYESTFLDATSTFERFQEELFFSCLLGASGIRKCEPIAQFRNRAEAERVVLATDRRGYISWSQMNDNIRRADAYLAHGRPFSRLQRRARDLEVLATATKIRNAIAHESRSAAERFRKLPLGSLPIARRTPAGYLRLSVGVSTQHETILSEYSRIASALAAPTDVRARKLLRAEDRFESGREADRGTYVCVSCGYRLRHRAAGRLSACSCSPGACAQCGAIQSSRYERMYAS
jgi:hypothetical protein